MAGSFQWSYKKVSILIPPQFSDARHYLNKKLRFVHLVSGLSPCAKLEVTVKTKLGLGTKLNFVTDSLKEGALCMPLSEYACSCTCFYVRNVLPTCVPTWDFIQNLSAVMLLSLSDYHTSHSQVQWCSTSPLSYGLSPVSGRTLLYGWPCWRPGSWPAEASCAKTVCGRVGKRGGWSCAPHVLCLSPGLYLQVCHQPHHSWEDGYHCGECM